MKKARIYILLGLCALSAHLWAVPARPDWIVMDQPDGTTIEICTLGDEFYHYWINRDGQEVIQDADGYWVVASEQLTSAQRKARRAESSQKEEVEELRKAPVSPMPTKMLVILVNFSDRSIDASHGNAYYDDWLNGTDHQPYGSVWEYFNTTSDGLYSPHWDVFGPVTLDNPMAYYGGNDNSGDDLRPREMAFEACEKADAMGCDFTQYDANNDGTVDNVYIIYAGYAESSCSSSWPNAIWPHSWSISSSIATHKIDGKTIYKYGCSAELDNCSGNTPDGIGTFCHEFSHVIGMPDYYDTQYGDNYSNSRTPGRWSLMDHGSYNGNGNRPPLYSIFDKCYMGWASMPALLPKDAKTAVTMPVGSQYARYITGTKSAKNYTSTDTIFYLENRQQTGKFDYSLPGHGLVIWQVVYRSSWSTPNNVAGAPRYTLLSATGSVNGIGSSKDSYPGTNKVTQKSVRTGCTLSGITESTDGVISFSYNGGKPAMINQQESFQFVSGQTYTWRGRTLSTPGTYYDTARSEFGDTAISLTLSYADPVKTIIYTGPNQLDEVKSSYYCGLHTNAFDQSIVSHYFSNQIGAIIFADTLRTIGDYAFYCCRKDKSDNQILTITLPDKVTAIKSYAFYGCYEMTDIDLGTSVQTIGYKTFYTCKSLKYLTLPETTTSLDKYALQNCSTLVSITVEAKNPPSCYSNTFSGLTRPNITLNVYPISLSTYKTTDEWKKFYVQPIPCDEPITNLTKDTICQGETYIYKGQSVKETSVYADTTWNNYGCATTIDRLEISVMPRYTYSLEDISCNGEPYIWHNQMLTETGIYFDSLKTMFGCDSIYKLDLIVTRPSIKDTAKLTINEGDSIEWHDKYYLQEGLYADSVFSEYGCITGIYFLELTVIPATPTRMDDPTANKEQDGQTKKYFYQEQLYIERNGILYDATGRKATQK